MFKLNKRGSATFIHIFAQVAGDGERPNPSLVRDASGNILGATQFGGADGYGTIFEVTPWGRETVIYSFYGSADGGIPSVGVYRDPQGNVYGTTSQGGSYNQGTVFKLTSSGQHVVPYNFSGTDGAMPVGGVTLDQYRNVYGVTYQGGRHNKGTIFKLDANGNLTVLHDFRGIGDGKYPLGLLLANGVLHGVTYQGGAFDYGVVFKLIPRSWQVSMGDS